MLVSFWPMEEVWLCCIAHAPNGHQGLRSRGASGKAKKINSLLFINGNRYIIHVYIKVGADLFIY